MEQKLILSIDERKKRIKENPPIPTGNNGVSNVNTIYGYTRVSTMMQVLDGVSLDVQDSQIRDFCINKDLGEPKIFVEEGKSGRKKDREKFNYIIDNLKPGDTLICYSQSRLTRLNVHFLEFLEDMKKRKIRVVCLKEKVDLDYMNNKIDAMSNMYVQIIGSFSEGESARKGEATSDAMRRMSADGTLHRRPYFGTKYVSDPDKPGKKIQVLDEVQQKIIDYIYNVIEDAGMNGEKIIVADIVRSVNHQIAAGNLNYKNKPSVDHSQITRIINRQGFRELLNSVNSA